MGKEKRAGKTAKKTTSKPENVKRTRLYYSLFFLFIAILFYSNTRLNTFSVDDEYVTKNNPQIMKGIKGIPEIFTTFYVSNEGNLGEFAFDYRPLVKATYAIEFQLLKRNPEVSHVINVLLYAFTGIFLFFLLKRMLRNYHILFPFLITLLFMAHPIHSEVVNSLKNRDEMMSFLGGIIGLHYILKYAETSKWKYLGWCLFFFILGYFSKSSVISFLLIYPLALYFFSDIKPRKIWVLLGVLFVVVLIAQFGPRIFLPEVQRDYSYVENPLFFEKDFRIRTGTALMSLIWYLKLLVYPYPMVYYYGYDMIPLTGWNNVWVIFSFILYTSALAMAIYMFLKRHILSFGILFYLIAIAAFSNLVVPMVGIIGERFLYTASLGFIIVLVYLVMKAFGASPELQHIPKAKRTGVIVCITLLLIPCLWITRQRNKDWYSLHRLLTADIEHLHNSAKANTQFAGHHMRMLYYGENPDMAYDSDKDKTGLIIRHFRRSLEIYPKQYQALNDLGTVYAFMRKDYDSANHFIQQAKQMDPEKEVAFINLAFIAKSQKKYDETIRLYRHVLKLNPKKTQAWYEIAEMYKAKNLVDSAMITYGQIMQADPSSELPYLHLGDHYLLQQDTTTAVSYYEKAAEKKLNYQLSMNLYQHFYQLGDREKADYYYGMAMRAQREQQQNQPNP
ncbi:MAG: hypothetical protein FJY10_06110 [Bacteroidetes bacterium]|nr:hypothetical protein [Bacteroidota bacterium]